MRLDDGFGRTPRELTDKVFTVLFPFCGVGGSALGFQGSRTSRSQVIATWVREGLSREPKGTP